MTEESLGHEMQEREVREKLRLGRACEDVDPGQPIMDHGGPSVCRLSFHPITTPAALAN